MLCSSTGCEPESDIYIYVYLAPYKYGNYYYYYYLLSSNSQILDVSNQPRRVRSGQMYQKDVKQMYPENRLGVYSQLDLTFQLLFLRLTASLGCTRVRIYPR